MILSDKLLNNHHKSYIKCLLCFKSHYKKYEEISTKGIRHCRDKENQLYKAVFDKQRLHRMIPKQHHNCSEKEDVT